MQHKMRRMKRKQNEGKRRRAKLFLVVETLNVSTNIIN